MRLARARTYRVNILMLEAGTAIDPLRNPYRAGKILDQLTAMDGKLSPKLRGILLRYRIRQYQLAGENNKILPLVQKFASESTQNSADVIKGLIGQYDQESRRVRHTDPGKSQRLAASAAALLNQLILSLQSQPGKKIKMIYMPTNRSWHLNSAALVRANRHGSYLRPWKSNDRVI